MFAAEIPRRRAGRCPSYAFCFFLNDLACSRLGYPKLLGSDLRRDEPGMQSTHAQPGRQAPHPRQQGANLPLKSRPEITRYIASQDESAIECCFFKLLKTKLLLMKTSHLLLDFLESLSSELASLHLNIQISASAHPWPIAKQTLYELKS